MKDGAGQSILLKKKIVLDLIGLFVASRLALLNVAGSESFCHRKVDPITQLVDDDIVVAPGRAIFMQRTS